MCVRGWKTSRRLSVRQPRPWRCPGSANRSSWCMCGAQPLAWFEAGYLADAAGAADAEARRRGFGQHFFAIEHLRALAGLALERRDLGTAEQLTEQALS